MPKVIFEGQEIDVEDGKTLREALFEAGVTPHNGNARWFNCKGFGSCGTCAVRVDGEVGEKTRMERWRLDFPPHQSDDGLRLACQIKVHSDLVVAKYDGFWGQDVSRTREGIQSPERDSDSTASSTS